MSSGHTCDKRCRKTRAAVESALYDFYGSHSHFERLPVTKLCKVAKVSTPTFYRHYKGVHDVVRAKDRKMSVKLKRRLGDESLLTTGLVRAFSFVKENDDYYVINFLQQYEKPFENLARILEPKILEFVKLERKTRRSVETDQRICSEIEHYLIFEIKWWIERDACDFEKSTERINAVIFYSKCRIYEMEEKLRKKR
ncbi:MAG: hypothetical protein Q4A25_00640 [Candidatus Saccharibacteria bacterium]|nr:hypothetical protein [Candidatus Saccharibacteria bacterium]